MNEPDGPEQDRHGAEDAVHEYRAAGIRERTGRIPWWLIAVGVGLLVWGGYYIVRFWTPSG